jgi:CHAT domain-containing protein
MAKSDTSIHLRLPGREVAGAVPASSHADIAQLLKIEQKKAVVVDVYLRGAEFETVPFDANPNDVVELEYEGGLRQWIRVDQLRDDLQKRKKLVMPAADEHEVIIPPDLAAPATRGGGFDLLLKGLKIFGIDPVGDAANLAVRAAISKFEDSIQPGPGLYVLSDPWTVERQVHDKNDLDNRSPYLLFLHGTASSVSGSFGGLAPAPDGAGESVSPEDWNALKQRYPGRILGLQHKTLSVSPVQNALDAARLLPQGAQLHLVSHSRGGLVGELLCVNEMPGEYRSAFARVPEDVGKDISREVLEARNEEAERFEQLAMELNRKQFAVQRFVRVACPARGTVLASRRLDLYLSVLLNVIGLIPALKSSPLYSLLKAVTLESVRRRTDPRQLPGIEAMMPESPLINLLNQKELTSAADLAVIAGDLAPEGIWQRLKTLAVDLFYLQANDLVVHTIAMYGGMERRTTAFYFFNKGPHVNHFHYFRNPGTRSLLRKWLEAGSGERVEGFRQFVRNQTLFVADERRAADAGAPRPIVFVVPDLMGTQLEDDHGALWPSLSGLAKGGLDRLADFTGKVKSGDLVAELYAPLVNRLQQRYRVEPAGYDWRMGLDEIANELRIRIQPYLEDDSFRKETIHFVAHGAGALGLLRLAADKDFWDRIADRKGRIVLLGAPILGCAALSLLRDAKAPLNRLLRMADHQSKNRPEEVFKQFQSFEEFRPESVQRLGLRTASELRNLLAIVGKAERTVSCVRDDGTVLYTNTGDGLVTSEASHMDGVPMWQVNVPHGILGRHKLVVDSVAGLLDQGDAPKLQRVTTPPSPADGFSLALDEPLFFPTEEDLLDAALGGKAPSQFDVEEHPIKVSVSHGHLRQARFPVMVGHYDSDMIVSAEKALDFQLEGRLTQRFNMGVYPGRIGTVEIVLAPASNPPGALVIGLGEIGELTREKLRRTVRAATLRYALLRAEQTQTGSEELIKANFSAVLMGTYGQGSIRDAVSAIVRGALDANRQLDDEELGKRVRVEEIEIIEIYRDMAAEAAHELLTLAERLNGYTTTGALLTVAPHLKVLEGHRVNRPSNPYATGWWRRIKINQRPLQAGERQPMDGLEFTVLTDRARAEDFVRGTQRQVLEPILQEATRRTEWNEQLSTVLFQLLIPRDLRSYLQDRVNLVLILDEEAANYPWELLAQRTRSGVELLAVQSGLLRQLRSSSPERRMPQASVNAALIVGDSQSGWSDLAGAQEEAEAVQVLLEKAEYKCTPLKKKDSMAIISALLSQEFRILHLAGHGNFDPNDVARRGMKIGPDQWLTPDILDGILAAPDLAFVNCCHLGHVEGAKEGTPSPQLAASFAVKLMNLGAKAVVAAGWAVDDRAARAFADRFYQRMLEGERFGDAVLDARQQTKELYPGSNTWGAYQCYGNPDFRLIRARADVPEGSRTRRFVSREEILQIVADIASEATGARTEHLLNELADLRSELPADWWDGEVLAAFGHAYSQLGKFEEAIAAYRQALAGEDGRAPVRAALQIANLLDRLASKAPADQQKGLRNQAREWFEKTAALAETAESAALRAGNYKRNGDLKLALEAYEKSFELRKRASSDELYYPGLNAATLAFLLDRQDEQGIWKQRIRECEEAAIRQRAEKRDVWARAGVVDAMLLRTLWEGTLEENRKKIAHEYVKVIKGGGSQREIDSILGQIDFLKANLPEGDALRAPLEAIMREVNVQSKAQSVPPKQKE